MITGYKPVASLAAAVFSFMVVSPASALEIAQAETTQPTQGQAGSKGPDAAISDQKIEAFAVAYLQVDKVRQVSRPKQEYGYIKIVPGRDHSTIFGTQEMRAFPQEMLEHLKRSRGLR